MEGEGWDKGGRGREVKGRMGGEGREDGIGRRMGGGGRMRVKGRMGGKSGCKG